ncbi:MAG: hypothetical protein ACOH1Y_11765 [Propionicimonas sp.]
MPRTPSAPSISRLEVADIAIQQILDASIPEDVRALLVAAKEAVFALRPNIDPADHMPIYTDAADGTTGQVGCSCGARPKTRAARMSMTMAFYNTHLNRVGLPRTNEYPR